MTVIQCRHLAIRLTSGLTTACYWLWPTSRLNYRDSSIQPQSLRFVINWEKSDLVPTQEWEVFGVPSLYLMTVFLLQEKVSKLQAGTSSLSQ